MKKKTLFFYVVVCSLIFTTMSIAKPVHLMGTLNINMDPVISEDGEKTLKEIKVTCVFSNPADVKKWRNYIALCPDPIRASCDVNVPFSPEEENENTLVFIIPGELVVWGQSSFNFADDGDNWFEADWLHIPDCRRVILGRNVIYYDSKPDERIEKSGGMQFLYVGFGAHFYPKKDDPLLFSCEGLPSVKQTAWIPEPIAQPPAQAKKNVSPPVVEKASPPVAKKSLKKATKKCDPCEEIAEVKTDTEAIRKSVGNIDSAEPFEEQTLQNKGKKILGISKEVKSAIGTGKPDKEGNLLTVHEKIGEPVKNGDTVVGLLEKIDKQTSPVPVVPKLESSKTQSEESFFPGLWGKIEWWHILILLAIAVLCYLAFGGRR